MTFWGSWGDNLRFMVPDHSNPPPPRKEEEKLEHLIFSEYGLKMKTDSLLPSEPHSPEPRDLAIIWILAALSSYERTEPGTGNG